MMLITDLENPNTERLNTHILITLCNIAYMLLFKVFANRMKVVIMP